MHQKNKIKLVDENGNFLKKCLLIDAGNKGFQMSFLILYIYNYNLFSSGRLIQIIFSNDLFIWLG